MLSSQEPWSIIRIFTPASAREVKILAAVPFAMLDQALETNPMKGEYFLPSVVSQLLAEDKARVRVLSSADKWYGVTYKEDKPVVVNALTEMRRSGLYPMDLWNE